MLLERLSHRCLNYCNAKTTGGNIDRQPLPKRHELIDGVGFLHLLRACFVEREPLGSVVAIARANPVRLLNLAIRSQFDCLGAKRAGPGRSFLLLSYIVQHIIPI